jgi:hypothetical protein
MCLIAYVKAGLKLPEANFRSAAAGNSDGIGIMSKDGVEKFVGRKATKKAWRMARRLMEANAEFGIHFRYATHGAVSRDNTHPFRIPNGAGYVMHNGVLEYYSKRATETHSDTRLFIEGLSAATLGVDDQYWKKTIADYIGRHNKLLVMSWDGQFTIVNEDSGDWIDGIWYSQTYSLPGYGWKNDYAYSYSSGKTDTYYGDSNYRGLTYINDDYSIKSVEAALERKYGPSSGKWRDNKPELYAEELAAHTASDAPRCDCCGESPVHAEGMCEECIMELGGHQCPSCDTVGIDAHCTECGWIDDDDMEQLNSGWSNNSRRLRA